MLTVLLAKQTPSPNRSLQVHRRIMMPYLPREPKSEACRVLAQNVAWTLSTSLVV